ncbi:MAG: anti-sigma factor domain-containing protein [Paenibacillaceae bacterium]|nr:anti-sigma factor domain-containing protein [Paenibacillaceae bacterium]
MNKGIVMDVTAKGIVVMTPEGGFERIPREGRSCEIGEEIIFAPPSARRFKRSTLTIFSSAVAAVVLCLVLIAGMPATPADAEVVAYISIDINPSVELGIDKNRIVREMTGLNADGIQLIANVKFKGKPIDEVTEELLAEAEKTVLASGEGDIVIASTVVSEAAAAKVDDVTLSEQLKQQVTQHLQKEHPDNPQQYEVTAFAAPSEVRTEAKSQGLSTGKYTVYLNAKDNGQDVKKEDFVRSSIHSIAKDAGGIDKLMGSAQTSKDKMKELLKEEKDGTLDKKQQQKLDEKKADNAKKNSPSPSRTPSRTPTPTPKSTLKATPASNKPTATKTPDKNNNGKNDDKNDNGKNDDKNDNGKNDDKNNNGKNDDKNNNGKNDDKNDNGKNDNKNDNGKNDNGKNDDGKNDNGKNDNGKNDDGKRTPTPTPKSGVGDKDDDKKRTPTPSPTPKPKVSDRDDRNDRNDNRNSASGVSFQLGGFGQTNDWLSRFDGGNRR